MSGALAVPLLALGGAVVTWLSWPAWTRWEP